MTVAAMAHNLHLTAVDGAFPAPHNSSSLAPHIPNLDTHDFYDSRQHPTSNASAREMAAMRRMFQRRQQTTGSSTETVDMPFDGSAVTIQRANSVASSTSSRGRRSGSSRESDPRSGTKASSKSSKPLFSSGAFTSMGYAYASGAGPIIQAPLVKRQLPKTPQSALPSVPARSTQKTQPFVTRMLARPPAPPSDGQQVIITADDKVHNTAVPRGGSPQCMPHPALHVAIAGSSQQRSNGGPILAQTPPQPSHPPRLVDPYSPETPLSAISSTSGSVPTSISRTPDTPLSFGSSTYATPVSSPTVYQPLSSAGIRSKTLPARNSSLGRHTSIEIANNIVMQNGMPASPPPPRRPRSTSPAPPLPGSSRSPNDNAPPTSFNTFSASLNPASPTHISIGKRMSQDEYLPRPSAPFAASSRSQSAPSSPIMDKPLPPVHSSSVDDSHRVVTALAALGPERSPVKLEEPRKKSPLAGQDATVTLERFADVVHPTSAVPVQTRAPPSLAIIPPSPGVNQSFAISSSPSHRHSSYSSTDSPSTIRALDTVLHERTSAESGRSTPPLSEGSSASSITSDESLSSLAGLTGGSVGDLVLNSTMDNISANSSRVTSPTTLRMRRRGYNFAEGLYPGSNGTSPAGSPGISPIPSPMQTRPASMALGEAWPFASLTEPNGPNKIRQPGPGPHPIYSQHSAARSADFTPRPAEDDDGDDELKSEFHFYRHSGDKDRDPEVLNVTRPTSSLALNHGEDDDGDDDVVSFAPSWPLPTRNNDVWPEQSSIVLMRYNDVKKGKLEDVDLWREADVIEVMAALRELRPAPLKGRK